MSSRALPKEWIDASVGSWVLTHRERLPHVPVLSHLSPCTMWRGGPPQTHPLALDFLTIGKQLIYSGTAAENTVWQVLAVRSRKDFLLAKMTELFPISSLRCTESSSQVLGPPPPHICLFLSVSSPPWASSSAPQPGRLLAWSVPSGVTVSWRDIFIW